VIRGPFVHPTRPGARIGPFELLDDAARDALVAETRAGAPDNDDFWVFAYGSLIWNPCFAPADQRVARVEGLARRFCFWTVISRGSPDRPGLGMGLFESDRACTGVLQRMNPETRAADFEALWRREMLSGVYRPTWVDVRPRDAPGAVPVRALTFVVDPDHPQFAAGLTPEEEVAIIATASGRSGPCSDYLTRMVDALDRLGIPDPEMRALHEAVCAFNPGAGGEDRR
jgi:cation transport protein ChaC